MVGDGSERAGEELNSKREERDVDMNIPDS